MYRLVFKNGWPTELLLLLSVISSENIRCLTYHKQLQMKVAEATVRCNITRVGVGFFQDYPHECGSTTGTQAFLFLFSPA